MLINNTGTLSGVLSVMTNNVTGSLFLSMFLVFIVLLFLVLAFKVPLEYAILLMLPILIVQAAYSSQWNPLLGVCLIFIAVFFARNWFVQAQ
jgi:hypothetical protein